METKKDEPSMLVKLKKVYDEIGQDMQYFQTGLNFVKMLAEQGHKAETIACYLVLHCGVYAHHDKIKEALIKHEIVTD